MHEGIDRSKDHRINEILRAAGEYVTIQDDGETKSAEVVGPARILLRHDSFDIAMQDEEVQNHFPAVDQIVLNGEGEVAIEVDEAARGDLPRIHLEEGSLRLTCDEGTFVIHCTRDNEAESDLVLPGSTDANSMPGMGGTFTLLTHANRHLAIFQHEQPPAAITVEQSGGTQLEVIFRPPTQPGVRPSERDAPTDIVFD
jgi:hypothetical protein